MTATWIMGAKGCCAYCDTPFDDSCHATGATRDHIIPKALTKLCAAPRPDDKVLACGNCNHLKRNFMPDGMREAAGFLEARADRLRQIADRTEALIKKRGLI